MTFWWSDNLGLRKDKEYNNSNLEPALNGIGTQSKTGLSLTELAGLGQNLANFNIDNDCMGRYGMEMQPD